MRVYAVRYVPPWDSPHEGDTWIADFADRVDALEYVDILNHRYATGTADNGGGYYLVEQEDRG